MTNDLLIASIGIKYCPSVIPNLEVDEDPYWKEIQEESAKLLESLGLPHKSLAQLLEGDDWSFVIKLHALLESAVTWALQEHLKPQNLDWLALKLNWAGSQGSKLDCCKTCELLETGEVQFIRQLSKIRNRLAHNIRYVSFDLTAHLNALEKEDQNEFLKSMMEFFSEPGTNILLNPRRYLFWASVRVVAGLVVKTDVATLDRKNKAMAQETELLRAEVQTLKLEIELARGLLNRASRS